MPNPKWTERSEPAAHQLTRTEAGGCGGAPSTGGAAGGPLSGCPAWPPAAVLLQRSPGGLWGGVRGTERAVTWVLRDAPAGAVASDRKRPATSRGVLSVVCIPCYSRRVHCVVFMTPHSCLPGTAAPCRASNPCSAPGRLPRAGARRSWVDSGWCV